MTVLCRIKKCLREGAYAKPKLRSQSPANFSQSFPILLRYKFIAGKNKIENLAGFYYSPTKERKR
jgi:hypothetical protein